MKKILNIVLILFIMIALFGCTDINLPIDNEPTETNLTDNEEELDDEQAEVVDHSSHAYAYFMMFQYLFQNNTGLIHDGTLYVAIDFSELEFNDIDLLTELIETYTVARGSILLFGTLDELVEQGYVAYYVSSSGKKLPTYFETGIYFKISNSIYNALEINCNAYIWKGNLGATGGAFHAIFEDDEWVVERNTQWVS